MICALILIVLVTGFDCSHFPAHIYYYVGTKMNFPQAQQYCREKFKDMASIGNIEELSRLSKPSLTWTWIGLSDDPISWMGIMGNDSNSWRWSVTGQTSKSKYSNWSPGQPDFAGAKQTCVGVNSFGGWNDYNCEVQQMSICFDAIANGKSYVVVNSLLRWPDAQAYCRQFHTDLALVENAGDNAALPVTNVTNFAWIGLYRVPWSWSDKSRVTFTNFDVGQPDNQGGEHCVVDNPNHFWHDASCSITFTFFCYKDTSVQNRLGMNIQTDADMTDPAINNQILQQISAALQKQGWTDLKLKWGIQPRNK